MTKILVVDDFEPFRKFIVGQLQGSATLQVVGEARDGLEAIQKAELTQPDLVLLDLHLPKLNGMKAAQRMLHSVPRSRILFVSQEYSSDLVREAFQLGAMGFINKTSAGRSILPAIDAALRGRPFVSGRITERQSSSTNPRSHHEALFYSDDAAFVDELARVTHDALAAGNSAIVAATEEHQSSLEYRFKSLDFDAAQARSAGRLVFLDATEIQSRYPVDGIPDFSQFAEELCRLIVKANSRARSDTPCVTIFGELVALFCAAGNREAAISLEQLWNSQAPQDCSTLCAYPVKNSCEPETCQLIAGICDVHSEVHSV